MDTGGHASWESVSSADPKSRLDPSFLSRAVDRQNKTGEWIPLLNCGWKGTVLSFVLLQPVIRGNIRTDACVGGEDPVCPRVSSCLEFTVMPKCVPWRLSRSPRPIGKKGYSTIPEHKAKELN